MVSPFDSLSIPSAEMTPSVAVWLGVLASFNLCAVVRLPVLAAYVAGVGTSGKRAVILAGLFALGLAGGTWLLGQAATPMADGAPKILQVNKSSFWILGFSLIATGVLISGLLNSPLAPGKCRRVGQWLAQTSVPGALLLGLVFGLLQTPACPACRTQLLAVVDAAPSQSLSLGSLLVDFAVGQGLVALGVGLMVALLKPTLFAWLRTQMCSLEQWMQLLTGNMLIVLGIYFVIVG